METIDTAKLVAQLVNRETELERKRVTKLARQMWADVIELEARIEECKLWRAKLATVAQGGLA